MGDDIVDINYDSIVKCLSLFIREHDNDAALQALALNEATLQGRRVREKEGVWFIGDWVVEGGPLKLSAYWSRSYTSSESSRVIVMIEKSGDDYVVVDWNSEETF